MSTVAVLFALLAASYLGAFTLASSRGRGVAASWILVGVALGPTGLGVASPPVIEAVTPLAVVGIGWIALVAGLRFGVAAERRVRPGAVAIATIATLATAAAVSAVALWLLARLAPDVLGARERMLVAGGTGLACAELGRRMGDLAVAVGVAALFAFCGAPAGDALGGWGRLCAELGGGVALGALAALLLRDEWREPQALAVLFGTSLVSIGLASGLRLSGIAATFAMGVALSAISRHAARLRAVAATAEAPVVIPVLLLAGAHLDLRAAPWIWAIASAAVAVRVLAKVLTAALLAPAVPSTRGRGARLARALARSGALGASLALAVGIALPGAAGAVALTAATAAALAGPLVAPVVAYVARGGRTPGRGDDAPAVEGSP